MTGDQDDELLWDPLGSGSASMPPILGAGCASRFDPHSLNEECGADFSSARWPATVHHDGSAPEE